MARLDAGVRACAGKSRATPDLATVCCKAGLSSRRQRGFAALHAQETPKQQTFQERNQPRGNAKHFRAEKEAGAGQAVGPRFTLPAPCWLRLREAGPQGLRTDLGGASGGRGRLPPKLHLQRLLRRAAI